MNQPKQRNQIAKWLDQESVAGVVCAFPFIAGFLLFLLVPMLISLYYSFCNYNILSEPAWVGFANYIKAFTDDPTFYQSIGVTFFYALISVPLRLVFALIVALFLLKVKPGGFGIGLLNIQKRLQLFGGNAAYLQLKNVDNMAVACIHLPIHDS